MKKILMILTALICMAVTAQAQTVYVSTGSDAVAYHKNKSCSYLQNSKDVKSVSTAEAKKMGRHECQRCYGTAAAAKKTTTTKKTTTKAAKKSAPARDEKGRFVKKVNADAPATVEKTTTAKKTTKTAEKKTTKTAAKKSTPARDEKGRFIKKTDQKSTTKKTTEKKVKKAA